jgi:TonB-dependent receptor
MAWNSRTVRASALVLTATSTFTSTALAQDATADSGRLEEVVVTGQRASLEAATEKKRNADQVIESVVADDIGKFPDNTVAEALQRIPGIQTTNNFNNEIVNPLIRGIGDIETTVDGREMFTGVGRGFAFQDLPSEALAAADVYKSNSANLLEGGVAGVINLKLHKPFDFKEGLTLATNARGYYGDQVQKLNYKVGLLASEQQETSAGRMGLLLDLSYSDNDFNRPISFNCDPRSGTNGPPGAVGVVLPTCVGGLTDNGSYQRPQANAAFQWRPNDNLEIYADALFAGYRAEFETDFIFSDIFAAQSITSPVATGDCFTAHVNGAGFLGDLGNPNANPPRPPDPVQRLCFGSSATFNNVPGLTSTQAKTSRTNQNMYAGGARYESGALHLDLDVSHLESINKNRNIIVDIGKQIAAVDVTVDNGGHGTTDMPGNPLSSPNDFRFANGLFQDIDRADSTLFAVALDGAYDLGSGFIRQLQFGVRYGDRNAQYRSIAPGGPGAPGGNRVTLVSSAGLPSDFLVVSPANIPQINQGQPWVTPNANFLRDQTDVLRALYNSPAGDPPYDPSRNFDASEKAYAAYIQPKYELDFANGMMVDGLIGGRFTKTERDLSGTGRINGALTPVITNTSDTDFLPNFSARLRLTEQTQVRLTAARTISRPLFRDLNPGLTYDVPLNANIRPNGSGGNPDLKPQKSDAYDATLEHYFGRSNYVAGAVYYRTLKDRTAIQQSPEVINGITYNISRPRNLGGATLKGLELSAQVFFDFLPEGWNGLGAVANYTLADSNIDTSGDPLNGFPLLGVSKHSYNVGVLYEKFGLTGRLMYTWRDKFAEFQFGCALVPQAAGDAYCNNPGAPPAFNFVKAYGRLDFSLGYDVTQNITVSIDGNNLTGAKYHSYFNTGIFPHDIRTDDKFYGVSVRARL